MKSKRYKLNYVDILKSLLMAILTPAVILVEESLRMGIFSFNWKTILTASLGGGLAYLIKNFLENSNGELNFKFKKKNKNTN